jgi:hypothetical protein
MSDKTDCPIDCGDNSCLCASKRGGMRTNGGCRCFKAGHDYAENRAMAQRARLAVTYWRRRALREDTAHAVRVTAEYLKGRWLGHDEPEG